MNPIPAIKPEQLNSKLSAYCASCAAKNPASFRGAKDALTGEDYEDLCCDSCHSILATLSGRLPAGEAEPVAQWQKKHPFRTDGRWENTNEHDAKWWRDNAKGWEIRALYTTPQQSQPLTDEQIQDMLKIGNPTEEQCELIRRGWNEANGIKKGGTE